MSFKLSEHFEKHLNGTDAGTECVAKRFDDLDDAAYDDNFDEKLSEASEESCDISADGADEQDNSEKQEDGGHVFHTRRTDHDGVLDAKGGENLPAASEKTGPELKRTLPNRPSTDVHGYTMNTPKTIEHMREQMDERRRDYFDCQIDAGGGIDGERAHLRGAGREYYLTSSSDKLASGNFLTEESPGETPSERKENLQLPPENDATVVDKVISQRPAVVFTSTVAQQEKWAEQSGYEAKEGVEQVFTPSRNKKGAIEAGIYKIMQPESDAENSETNLEDEADPEKEKT